MIYAFTMRKVLFYALALFWIGLPFQTYGQVDPAPPASMEAICEVETDEFTEETSIVCPTREFTVEEQPSEIIFGNGAQLQRQGGQNYLVIVTRSDSWNFLDAEKAYAIIDGENYQFKLSEVDNEATDGSVLEQNAAFISSKILSRIAGCSEFRMKVGRAVFDLSNSGFQKQAEFLLSKQ